MEEACEQVALFASDRSYNKLVFTPNANITLRGIQEPEFSKVLTDADFLIPDGVTVVIASKIFGTPLKGKVSGSTFFGKCCERLSKDKRRVYLLGAMDDIAERTGLLFEKKYPGYVHAGSYSPPFGFEKDSEETARIIKSINDSQSDVLFIGLGNCKGERWVHQYRNKINVAVSLQVGAAFDFAIGLKKIPPEFFKKNGLGWLWRLITEPKRMFKRYFLNDIKIFYYIYLKMLNKRKKQ